MSIKSAPAATSSATVTEPKKRGRKPGLRVPSLDYRIFLTMSEIDWTGYAERADVGTRAWENSIIADIVQRFRDLRGNSESEEDSEN